MFLLLLAMLAASEPAALAQTTMTWTVDGVRRQALVFAPAPVLTTNAQPIPLVFAFHGHGGTMKAASQVMHLQTLWPGAVIVYPQGLNTPSQVDPQGNFPGWQVRAGQ
ncbi:MAG TPA: esterase, partial [Candidatus Angelobacter sp.]|nr:esterase [Candidatus Angelobacter sp.]